MSRRIIKDALIGFLITERVDAKGARSVGHRPISYSYDGSPFCDNELQRNENVIGILAAPPKSYCVYGLFPPKDREGHGEYREIGFEFEGADHPDWLEMLNEQIEEIEKIKKRKEQDRT